MRSEYEIRQALEALEFAQEQMVGTRQDLQDILSSQIVALLYVLEEDPQPIGTDETSVEDFVATMRELMESYPDE